MEVTQACLWERSKRGVWRVALGSNGNVLVHLLQRHYSMSGAAEGIRSHRQTWDETRGSGWPGQAQDGLLCLLCVICSSL